MKLQQNYTTPDQSERLIELGVPTNSADMYYCGECLDNDAIPDVLGDATYSLIEQETAEANRKSMFSEVTCVPCWSVGRLTEIINICSLLDKGQVVFTRMNCWYIDHLISRIGLELRMGWFEFSNLERYA